MFSYVWKKKIFFTELTNISQSMYKHYTFYQTEWKIKFETKSEFCLERWSAVRNKNSTAVTCIFKINERG